MTIKRKDQIECDCGHFAKVGEIVYAVDNFIRCKSCYDRFVADLVKEMEQDHAVKVCSDNFDLEEETMNLGYSNEFS